MSAAWTAGAKHATSVKTARDRITRFMASLAFQSLVQESDRALEGVVGRRRAEILAEAVIDPGIGMEFHRPTELLGDLVEFPPALDRLPGIGFAMKDHQRRKALRLIAGHARYAAVIDHGGVDVLV